ncbi:hypothetical protein MMC19_003774 [Ptychographa xylographoides]|nr:hypothetical protein [Ptychographa xylographoides]
MPTNRPFFANFLAAFRAQSALQKSASAAPTTSNLSSPTTSISSQTAHLSSSTVTTTGPQQTTAASAARAIATKSPAALTSANAAVQAAFSPTNPSHTHHTRHPSSSPASRSPAANQSLASVGGAAAFGSRTRRGSDSSSEGGFRDALGGEKWFIGGRTAQGEERFYRLGMVRRERSGDRASLDRMSL